jgi:hypothetical protein
MLSCPLRRRCCVRLSVALSIMGCPPSMLGIDRQTPAGGSPAGPCDPGHCLPIERHKQLRVVPSS